MAYDEPETTCADQLAVPPVFEHMGNLSHWLERSEEMLSMLEDRLSPLLPPKDTGMRDIGSNPVKEQNLSSHASSIRDAGRKAEYLCGRMKRIIGSLEI